MYHTYFRVVVLGIYLIIFEVQCKRPFYIFGHMVNSVEEIVPFLKKGANALESDVSFYSNGSIAKIYHGFPCDCNRDCNRSAKLSHYLNRLREITNPQSVYHDQLVFQFFDLKLSNVITLDGKYRAGRELADDILEYLWFTSGNSSLLKVLVYINTVNDIDTIIGFRDRFQERNVEYLLSNVGYDFGLLDSNGEILKTLNSANISSHIWQGSGITNCFSSFASDSRLRDLIKTRDNPTGYIDKIYHWTIDNQNRTIKSLELNVDGIITNTPELLVSLINNQFSENYEIASVNDNPFIKYISNE